MGPQKNILLACCLVCVLLPLLLQGACFALSDEKVHSLQDELKGRPTGDRIAFFAEQFLGTPYDIDPLGTYVTHGVIVADERIDCMYLVFRSVELALSSTPEGAVELALEKRFRSRGVLKNGLVVNYGDRFAYGEDMIYSGKWGKEITADIGKATATRDLRSGQDVMMLGRDEALKSMSRLRSGDLLFFIKAPQKTVAGEIVGHMGIVEATGGPGSGIYMIHASGRKGKGGSVRKTELEGYLRKMPFIGVKITRFP